MKSYIGVLMIASLMLVGCHKPVKQEAALNVDSLSVSEADVLLAQPADEAAGISVVPVANVVVNTEAAPLVASTEALITSSELPDETTIQTALKNLGLYPGDIDGKIGPKTKEAIKEFQRQNNLKADGKVGPKTWAVLEKAVTSNQ